jgi:hypothetical protein
MNGLDLGKRDMTVAYGDRTFALRAYREFGAWHGVIIENKTPLRNALPATVDAASCFAAAVQFVAATVDAVERAPVNMTGIAAVAAEPRS